MNGEASPFEDDVRPVHVDVGRNARAIEWLKAEMVASVGGTFRGLVKGREDVALDGLAEAVVAAYLLARRLGASFARLDLRVEALLRTNSEQGHQLERWYGDMSDLLAHWSRGRGE